MRCLGRTNESRFKPGLRLRSVTFDRASKIEPWKNELYISKYDLKDKKHHRCEILVATIKYQDKAAQSGSYPKIKYQLRRNGQKNKQYN